MDTKITFATLLLGFMLMACDPPQSAQEKPASTGIVPSNAPKTSGHVNDPPVPTRAADRAEATQSRQTPPELTSEAERSIKGARNVMLFFARALEQKQFDDARALLSPLDKQKWSRAAFAAIFADLEKITVAIPDGTTEGAAGSLFYTAPITITGNDNSGRPIRIEGEAVLRRVNDVAGTTPAQLRWHFETLTLDWVH